MLLQIGPVENQCPGPRDSKEQQVSKFPQMAVFLPSLTAGGGPESPRATAPPPAPGSACGQKERARSRPASQLLKAPQVLLLLLVEWIETLICEIKIRQSYFFLHQIP